MSFHPQHVNTRWLSLHSAITRLLQQWEPLKEFFDEEKIEEIDLLYLNIEGSEYKLLDQLIESGLINKIKHLQVQFHNYIDDASNKRKLIRKHLDKTHKCIFNFPFIWERWDRQN